MKFTREVHEGSDIQCKDCDRYICDGDYFYIGDDNVYCTLCHMDYDMDKKDTALAFARYCSNYNLRQGKEGTYYWFDKNGYDTTEEKMYIDFLKSIS